MSFLKRLFGGAGPGPERSAGPDTAAEDAGDGTPSAGDKASAADGEAARDRELLRADAERLQDELIQRQLRYADRSWTPSAQGGPRRAGDEGSADDG